MESRAMLAVSYLEMAFVSSPTPLDSPSTGAIAEVPSSINEIHEWQTFHVEFYVSSSNDEGIFAVDFGVDFDPNKFQVDAFEFSQPFETFGSFDLESPGFFELISTVEDSGVATTSPALFARVTFSAIGGVALDLTNGTAAEEFFQFDIQNEFILPELTLNINQVEPPPNVRLLPVTMDLDDNESIGLSDLVQLISEFGNTVDPNNPSATDVIDLDRNGTVDLSDLVIMVQNFGASPSSSDLSLPSSFSDPWDVPGPTAVEDFFSIDSDQALMGNLLSNDLKENPTDTLLITNQSSITVSTGMDNEIEINADGSFNYYATDPNPNDNIFIGIPDLEFADVEPGDQFTDFFYYPVIDQLGRSSIGLVLIQITIPLPELEPEPLSIEEDVDQFFEQF